MRRDLDLGQYQELTVVERVRGGVLLGARPDDLFLPEHLLPEGLQPGGSIEVFIYVDRDGKPQATTWEPAVTVGGFAYLRCVNTTRAGAYLDWGVPKDLFVPLDDQATRMVEGRSYVVAVTLDRKGERPVGSMRLAEHFDYEVEHLQANAPVELLVHGRNDAGWLVVVAGRYRGLLAHSEVRGRLSVGDVRSGFVRRVRPDNRVDVGLSRRGFVGRQDEQSVVLEALEQAGGTLPLSDRSDPEQIEKLVGLSKKAFKRAVGGLYKAKRITLREGSITLVE